MWSLVRKAITFVHVCFSPFVCLQEMVLSYFYKFDQHKSLAKSAHRDNKERMLSGRALIPTDFKGVLPSYLKRVIKMLGKEACAGT